MRPRTIRYALCALMCLVLMPLWGQEKFSEQLSAVSEMTPYQAIYHLEQYQKKFPWFAGVYYHLGMANEKQIPTIHPILDYDLIRRMLYNARVCYGNCKHYAQDASLKNEDFAGLPTKRKRVEYEDVARFANKKLQQVKNTQMLVDHLYNSYYCMVKRYADCRQMFTQFCETYPGEKQAHLRLQAQDIDLLNRLAQQFDSLKIDITTFESALANYPIDNYTPTFSFSDIQLYRLDGLTQTNFMEPHITLWNYGDFAKQFLQQQEHEYGEYYQAIQHEFMQIDHAARKANMSEYQAIKTNKILTNYINKMDYESFMVPLTSIQQMCAEMIQCHAQGVFAGCDTVDVESIEFALNTLFYKYQRMDTCQSSFRLLQERLSCSELDKYKSVLGKDTTTQAVLSLANDRMNLADTVYGAISQHFYAMIKETLTTFDQYTDPLTEQVIYAHQLPQREADIVAVLPMANDYLVVYADGYLATVNTQLELLHHTEYAQYAPIQAAYKIPGNVIALVSTTRINYIISD